MKRLNFHEYFPIKIPSMVELSINLYKIVIHVQSMKNTIHVFDMLNNIFLFHYSMESQSTILWWSSPTFFTNRQKKDFPWLKKRNIRTWQYKMLNKVSKEVSINSNWNTMDEEILNNSKYFLVEINKQIISMIQSISSSLVSLTINLFQTKISSPTLSSLFKSANYFQCSLMN